MSRKDSLEALFIFHHLAKHLLLSKPSTFTEPENSGCLWSAGNVVSLPWHLIED